RWALPAGIEHAAVIVNDGSRGGVEVAREDAAEHFDVAFRRDETGGAVDERAHQGAARDVERARADIDAYQRRIVRRAQVEHRLRGETTRDEHVELPGRVHRDGELRAR